MKKYQKIGFIEDIARAHVADGKSPNLFFVSQEGVNILITRDWEIAYNAWIYLPWNVDTALEDRKWGVICSNELNEQGKWRSYDDSDRFLKRKVAV
jgi:hypothetical protein